MSETKHTQGPWKWHWRTGDYAAPGSVFAEPHEGQAYAVAMMPRYQTKEQWEADATLIAAAPDLLAACEASETAAAHWDDCEACQASEFSAVGCGALYDLAANARSLRQSAIAKATGE